MRRWSRVATTRPHRHPRWRADSYAKRAAVRSASAPCQLRVTSFASKFCLLDRHPLYVSARAAPHVCASHYGPRLAHDSKEYGHGPKITSDWQDHYGLANAIGYCEAVGRVSGMSRRRDSPLWRWGVGRALGGGGQGAACGGCGARAPGVGALRLGLRCLLGTGLPVCAGLTGVC